MIGRRLLLPVLAVLAAVGGGALSGCSTGSEKPRPAALEPLAPKIAARAVWRQSVGTPLEALSVAVIGDRFLVAGEDGRIVALDIATGTVRAQMAAGDRLTAGVGSDGRHAAVVTRGNELVVLDGDRVAWRVRLPARVTTPPLVAGERVFVQAVDRSLSAFDVFDGRRLWSINRSGEALALSQPGLLMPYRNTLLAGMGPRLLWLDPLTGAMRGEATLATPRGANEVERLADLVGPGGRHQDTVCARAFQASVACVQADRATLLWSRAQAGYQGVAADAEFVFGADSSDRIVAWRRGSGDVAWTHDRLRHRGLTAPLVLGSTVVFGDAEGLLHLLSRDRGEPLLRLSTDGSAIVAPPVRAGLTMLVVTRAGQAFAFRPE